MFWVQYISLIACWWSTTRDWKVVSSNPIRSGRKMFFSRVNFVCQLLFGARFTPVLLQWHVTNRPQSFCQKCKWQVTPKHAPKYIYFWPNKVGVGWLCRCPGMVWEPVWKRAHTQLVRKHTWPQSSQLAEPLWTDSGTKSGISVCELNSISKRKEKSAGRERMVEHSPKILASKEKPPPPPLVQENVTRSSSLLQV